MMRTIQGGDPVPVVWFRVPEDRPWLRGLTPFRSRNWRADSFGEGIGEQRAGKDAFGVEYREYHNGRAPAFYIGDDPCGDPLAWREGALPGRDVTFTTNAIGQPPCCSSTLVDGTVRIGIRASTPLDALPAVGAVVRIGKRITAAVGIPSPIAGVVRIGARATAAGDPSGVADGVVRIGAKLRTLVDPVYVTGVVRIGTQAGAGEGNPSAIGAVVRVGILGDLQPVGQTAESAPVRIGVQLPTLVDPLYADATVSIGTQATAGEGSPSAIAAPLRIGVTATAADAPPSAAGAVVRLGQLADLAQAPQPAEAAPVRIGILGDLEPVGQTAESAPVRIGMRTPTTDSYTAGGGSGPPCPTGATYSVTVAGVTGISSCLGFNRSYSLANIGGQQWRVPSGLQVALMDLGSYPPATLTFSLTSSFRALYHCSSFVCGVGGTFTLQSTGGTCGNWPATLTVASP